MALYLQYDFEFIRISGVDDILPDCLLRFFDECTKYSVSKSRLDAIPRQDRRACRFLFVHRR